MIATEDMKVLNLIDTDDAREACRIAQRNFPDFETVVFSEDVLEGFECRVTRDLPGWARRWRLEFAIDEGSYEPLRQLPMGPGRDLFFQGLGALVKWRDQIAARKSDFVVFVRGTLQSDSINSEARLSIGSAGLPRVRADVTHRATTSTNAAACQSRSFDLVIRHEPNYLVRLFEQAFELPGVPSCRRIDGESELVAATDLGVLGMAIGALAIGAHDPRAGRTRLESALYDLEARISSRTSES